MKRQLILVWKSSVYSKSRIREISNHRSIDMSKRTSWGFFAFILFLLISVVPSYAQDAKLRVDGDRTKSYIEWMSRNKLEGRHTFTQGYRKAAKWAAANFKQWGLDPAGDDGTYFQQVTIERKFTYMAGIPDLRIGKQLFLLEEEDFTVHSSSTAATSLHAEVVFAGYGISVPDKGLDEYADVDVEGKIVLVLKGSPNDVSTDGEDASSSQSKKSDAWKDYVSDEAKIKTAYEKGAGAILLHDIRPPTPQTSRQSWRGSGQTTDPNLVFERNFLVFTISGRAFRAIMKTDQQESLRGFNRRLEMIRQDISKKKAHSMNTEIMARVKGYDRVEKYNAEQGNNIGQNVIAKIKGTDPKLKNQYVIMGGHMDHLGMRRGLIYNGADDNASGTAVVLEVARVLSEADFKPKRTIIFCCWGGEEMGLLGSKHYVANPCDSVSIDRVVAYFNVDMVGLGDTIGAPGALNFPSIWEVIKRNQDKDVISAIDPGTGGPGGSDHSAFITKGIEALALMTRGGGGHPDYHRPEDDAAKMDPEILRKTGQFVLQGTINLANETEVELLIEDRQVLYEAMRLYVENINPDLEGSAWSYVDIDGYSKDKLRWRVAAVEKKPRKTLETGIKNLRIFQGDVELLTAASDALGFGRVDIKGSDGVWITEGRLTRKGRYALRVMEENKIVVNLVSPYRRLLRAVLATATRPFIVTGHYTLNQDICDLINKKKVLLGVKFDPDDVEGCVERLVKAKAALGDSDNLVLFVTSTEGLEEAKKALYISLVKKGWQADEIGGVRSRRRGRDRRPGIAGGNLGVLR